MNRRSILFGTAATAATISASTAIAQDGRRFDASAASATGQVRFQSANIDGIDIFYREAGPANGPGILLLHGFPTSSHMFRNLIPALADRNRVIAPDYPGYGYSGSPDRSTFAYTFDNYATLVGKLTEHVGLASYALYVMDYGAPVGFRIATAHPERVRGRCRSRAFAAAAHEAAADWAVARLRRSS